MRLKSLNRLKSHIRESFENPVVYTTVFCKLIDSRLLFENQSRNICLMVLFTTKFVKSLTCNIASDVTGGVAEWLKVLVC